MFHSSTALSNASVTGPVMNTTYSYEPNRDVKTTVDNAVPALL